MRDDCMNRCASQPGTIPIAEPDLGGNELAYLTDCIQSGWVSSRGAYVDRLEVELAAWCGTSDAVVTSSGTAALHLALLALGIGPGDEVIVPALTYVASANVIVYTGAKPVFVDVDEETWNIDLDQLPHQITPQTRAIMAVHLYGHPVDMERLQAIADHYGLWIIEDASEALGAMAHQRRVGGIGHIGCFSFYGNKLITTGEGGCLVTNSPDFAQKARSLRNQAQANGTYWHTQVGYNYRMTNLQAAVGLAQLERATQFVATRRIIASWYDQYFEGQAGLRLYREPSWGQSVCWLYSLRLEPPYRLSRDALIARLKSHQIESKPFFVPLPLLPAYQDGRTYPVAERLASCGISLPTWVKLTADQVERIAGVVLQGTNTDARLPG
jgi:perosamine synthetase